MPWWVPNWDHGMVAGLMAFGCGMAGWYVKTMMPAWKEQGIAKSKKIEADASLARGLEITTAQQTDLMERQTAMLNDHGVKLDSHGHMLIRTEKQIDELVRIQKRQYRDRTGDSDIIKGGERPT